MRCTWVPLLLALRSVGVDTANATHPNVQGICDSIHQLQCDGDDLQGGDIGVVTTHEACCAACEKLSACKAWTWNWENGQHCFLKSACSKQNHISGFHSGTGPTPPPAPSPPTPKPTPTPDNPLGIVPLPTRSDNFFLLLGDYGHDGGPNGCTTKVANMMNEYVKKQQDQGKKLLFVGALGDNFYSRGLKDSSKWASVWSNVYEVNNASSPLHGAPWMGVLGNHDHGGDDPGCPCGKGCKQISSSPKNFYIPDYNWNYRIDALGLEILGLDTNAVDVGGLGGDGCHGHSPEVCNTCGWGSQVQDYLNGVMSNGEQLLDERATASSATTVLIMQHYNWGSNRAPGKELKDRFEGRNAGKAKVLSAYGHRHEQKCEGSKEYGCDLILSGGGGGWRGGSGDYYFGFTAVHLTDDGGYQTVLETSDVRFSQHSCSWWGPGELGENTGGGNGNQEEEVVV